MNYLYEIHFLSQVKYELIVKTLGDFLNISPNQIGTSVEYYDLFNTDNELQVAITVHHFAKGYRTFITIEHLRFAISDLKLIQLAFEFAVRLKTDVTTGDLTNDTDNPMYITINPQGKYYQSYDSRLSQSYNSEIIDFTSYTDEAEIEDYFSFLDNE